MPQKYLSEEIITVWSLMHIVEDGVLRSDYCSTSDPDGGAEFDFHHMSSTHSAAFRETVDKSFVKV